MTSFYGGPIGLGLDIKANFASFDDMVAAFQQGDNYTTVWYGECAIINAAAPNDVHNGQIYRRTKTTPGYLLITQLGYLVSAESEQTYPLNTALIGIYDNGVYTSVIQPVYHSEGE